MQIYYVLHKNASIMYDLMQKNMKRTCGKTELPVYVISTDAGLIRL